MIIENSKKKIYQKPQLAIEEFELNEYVAGACSENGGMTMNVTSIYHCSDKDEYVEANWADMYVFDTKCDYKYEDVFSDDPICYYAAGGAYNVFTS